MKCLADGIADFYVSNSISWERNWQTARRLLPQGHVRKLENGILLPLRPGPVYIPSHKTFLGGCCDSTGRFVTGHRRHLQQDSNNFTVLDAYPVSENELEFKDEEVIYGGELIRHWGHLLTDTSARLWHAVANPDKKIVFCDCPIQEFKAAEDWGLLLEMAGINLENVEIVTRPTRFRTIVVPEQAVYSLEAFRPEWISFFDAIRQRIPPSPHRKVYFSRTHFSKCDVFNEDVFESYWEAEGFHVVHPEDCTLQEEISLVCGADELVSTLGTLSHNFLFAKPGARATVLLRASAAHRLQLMIGAARGIKTDYVEVCRNVLPTKRCNGVYFLAHTPCLKTYLKNRGLPPFGKERSEQCLAIERIQAYVLKWLQMFAEKDTYVSGALPEATELISTLKAAACGDAGAIGSITEFARNALAGPPPEMRRLSIFQKISLQFSEIKRNMHRPGHDL